MGADDVASGLISGTMGLFGLGGIANPLNDLRGKLSSRIQQFNDMCNEYNFSVATLTTGNQDLFNQLRTADRALAKNQMDNLSNMLWESVETENLFITFLYMLIFIIIIYLFVHT